MVAPGRTMNVLGISAFYHDSAACLVQDGRVVAAVQEERFSRRRFDAEMPWQAIRCCLELAGIGPRDLDLVAFYEKPLLRFDRAMATFVHTWPAGRRAFSESAPTWHGHRLRLKALLRTELDYRGRLAFFAHHEAHAASAFLPSPFERAAIVTVDGVGEWTTNSIGVGKGGEVELVSELRFPDSLGLLYAAVTEYLGFEILSDEYKVMGLAPYGEPRFAAAMREKLIDLRDDGSYELNLAYFTFLYGDHTIDPGAFTQLFAGPPRAPDAKLEDRHADVAASVQAVVEEALLRQARHAHRVTGAENLVLAGGVALNSVANGRIEREGPFRGVWIQPAAGDSGGAIGAALLGYHRALGQPRDPNALDGMHGALLGPSFDDARVDRALADVGLSAKVLEPAAIDGEVARRLARGEVIGWFQGRMEFGPRALGARSILADPRPADVQERVNKRIKFREGFRPFAPAVLEPYAKDWFEIAVPNPYMQVVAPVTKARLLPEFAERAALPKGLDRLGVALSQVPGVTHVDGSARVQTVDAERNPRFHALLSAFAAETGCPVVLNTSFNLRGEPIVCTPIDALNTFLASEIDTLVLGSRVVERPPGPPRALPPPPPRATSLAATRRFGWDLALGFAIGSALLAYRGGPAANVAALVLLAIALTTSVITVFRRQWLVPLARAWRPIAARVAKQLSRLLFAIVHLVVVGALALRRGPAPWARRFGSAQPSYWSKWEAPRGTWERMY